MIAEISPVFGEMLGWTRNGEEGWLPSVAFGRRSSSGSASAHASSLPIHEAIGLKYSFLLMSTCGVIEPAAIFICWSPSLSVQKANRNQGYRPPGDAV